MIKTDQQHTLAVQVRKDGVKGYVDGVLRADFKTDFSDMKANNWHNIRDKRLIAIGCDDPTVFYSVEVIEVSGAGKRTR